MKPLLFAICFLSAASVWAKPIPRPPRVDKIDQSRTVINPAKDLAILNDREESIVAFFRRQKIMVASMLPKELATTLEGKSAGRQQFVNYSSYNTEPMNARFGSNVTIETPTEPVVRLLREAVDKQGDRPLSLIFRIDEKNADQVAIVGYTYRSSVSFFNTDRRVPPDDFSPADLVYQVPKAK
jgi:hypothetical protein